MGIKRVAGLTWNRLLMRFDNGAWKSTSGMDKFGSVCQKLTHLTQLACMCTCSGLPHKQQTVYDCCAHHTVVVHGFISYHSAVAHHSGVAHHITVVSHIISQWCRISYYSGDIISYHHSTAHHITVVISYHITIAPHIISQWWYHIISP
jgi:hypothetical protein